MSPLVVPGLLLAAVLAVSGVAKLASPEANADAFVSLRLPRILSRWHAPRLLPYAEILLAVALLVAGGSAYVLVAVVGLALMLAYTGVVARALTFSEPVTCSCFGKLGLGAITRATVVRNLMLSLVAALTLADALRQSRSVAARILDADRTGWAWLGMIALGIAVTGLITHSTGAPGPGGPAYAHTDGQGYAEGAPAELDYVRAPIPFARLELRGGGWITLRDLASTHPRLLVFLNLGCSSCMRVVEILPAFVEANPEVGVHPVFHSGVDRDAIPEWMDYLLDQNAETAQIFGVPTPAAVLLGADGLLAGGPTIGEMAVREFLGDIAAELADARATRDQEETPASPETATVETATVAT